MPLQNKNSGSPEDSLENAKALERTKASKVPFIDRAPVSGDPGDEYWQYAKAGTNLTHWKRHPISGAWYSEVYT
jgi:hypothetical protein